jgi:pyruvate ferredoxin oxidoreductase beta subunit
VGKMHKRPVIDWIKSQGRFSHLLKDRGSAVVSEIQANVDKKWNELIKLSQM